MKIRTVITTFAAAGALMASPAFAAGSDQQSQAQDPQQQEISASEGAELHVSPETVSQIQQKLKDEGHDVGPIDGKMGPSTAEALRNFQQEQGMAATGNVNQATLDALDVDAGESAIGGGQAGGMGAGGSDAAGSGATEKQHDKDKERSGAQGAGQTTEESEWQSEQPSEAQGGGQAGSMGSGQVETEEESGLFEESQPEEEEGLLQ